MKRSLPSSRSGFTLVEVIASLLVVGVAMSMLLVLIGDTLTFSHRPRETLQAAYEIRNVMERMTIAYDEDINELVAAVGPEDTDQDNDFGQYHVLRNRYVAFDAGRQETADDGRARLRRITIRGTETGETMTRLFTF